MTVSDLETNLFSIDKLWNPGYFLDSSAIQTLSYKCCEVGQWLIVAMVALEFTRMYYRAATYGESIKLWKPFIKLAVFCFCLYYPPNYYDAFNLFLVKPVMAISNKLQMIFSASGLTKVSILEDSVKDSLRAGGNFFSSIDTLSITTLLASICFHLALVGLYLFSLIQQIYITVLFIVGPIFIPMFIFEVFSDIFISWFRKTLSVLCWSIFGTLAIKIIFLVGLFSSLNDNLKSNNTIDVLIISLGMLIICWMIPKISDQIVGGGLDAGLGANTIAGLGARGVGAVATGGASLAGEAAAKVGSKLG
jgi:hypothetical protein